MVKTESMWSKKIKQILKELKSTNHGLSTEEAEIRLKKYGHNLQPNLKTTSVFTVLLSQFKSPLIIILIGISIFSLFLGEFLNASIILVMLLINSIIGFTQEYKAIKSLEKLKKYIIFRTKVLRDNQISKINSSKIVKGDIVILNNGDLVPADIRIIETKNLTVNESILTGESNLVQKSNEINTINSDLPQDIKNGLFMGTSITSGYVKGLVIAIGNETFFGKTVQKSEECIVPTNFEKNIKKFSNILLLAVTFITITIFITNALLHRGIVNSFLFGVTLALGITPEILPIIITIALSTSAFRLSKKSVVVKRLSSLEDLGNMTVLCTDKTGTITEGKLQLIDHINIDGIKDEKTLLFSLICNFKNPKTNNKILENPIDITIWDSDFSQKLIEEVGSYEVIDLSDFDFEKQEMSILVKNNNLSKSNIFIVKGSSESIIKFSNFIYRNGHEEDITPQIRVKFKEIILNFENKGYRTIAVAYKYTDKQKLNDENLEKLTFLGFLHFIDPPKKSLKETFDLLEKLNIKLKIITGDSPIITKEICKEAGFEIIENKIITGKEIENLPNEAMKKTVNKYNTFARITPEQKLKIINSLKEIHHVVGYLGDGINDIGALKVSDVGISVDTGSDVAKDTSDIILLKKDLRILTDGVIEGRKTFNNTFKFIFNTMSSSFGNVFTIAISSMYLKFMPLLPSQVLFIDTLSDFQHLTISSDNVDEEFLARPSKWDNKFLLKFMMIFGPISAIYDFLLITIMTKLNYSPESFRTTWVVESILTELAATFSVRTMRTFYKSKPSKTILTFSFLILILTILSPFLYFTHDIFSFVNLDLKSIYLIFILILAYLITMEIVKKYFYKTTKIFLK